jgi:beta-glucosidase
VQDYFQKISSEEFGDGFLWGVAMAAAQNEGAHNSYGKGLSIWDEYAGKRGKIKHGHKHFTSSDFYHRYKIDLLLAKALGFKVLRFSISWPRILPEGTGKINKEGVLFYHRVIDECLSLGIIPFITLYHWDLPAALEKEGGWTSHLMLRWFTRYVTVCAEEFGDKVKNWIILNEPFGFTSLGYMLGRHAPGKRGLNNFFPAIHNAALAQAEGGRIIRKLVPQAYIGTSFSCSQIIPNSDRNEDILAAERVDILFNRLFIEPTFGDGYPKEDFIFLDKLEMHSRAWKYREKLQFDFDFIGLQNYFPIVVKYNALMPMIKASQVKASRRNVPFTDMGWEISPKSFYEIIKQFWKYEKVKEIIITENGAYFKDKIINGELNDDNRTKYFQQHLNALLQAQKEGVNIKGYFAWTLTDNFEWSEGYQARFGLIHVDFKTQLRTIKNSGYWFRNFLNPKQ